MNEAQENYLGRNAGGSRGGGAALTPVDPPGRMQMAMKRRQNHVDALTEIALRIENLAANWAGAGPGADGKGPTNAPSPGSVVAAMEMLNEQEDHRRNRIVSALDRLQSL